MKTLNELRESKPYDILFSERRKINGRATPLTEQETKAYNAGFKKGNDALWFESRRAAIDDIKQYMEKLNNHVTAREIDDYDSKIEYIKEKFNITEEDLK